MQSLQKKSQITGKSDNDACNTGGKSLFIFFQVDLGSKFRAGVNFKNIFMVKNDHEKAPNMQINQYQTGSFLSYNDQGI